MKNIDPAAHTRVNPFTWMIFSDTGHVIRGCFGSPVAHGLIAGLDVAAAEQSPGVMRVFTFRDVKGENQIGGIVPDEPLFAREACPFLRDAGGFCGGCLGERRPGML